METRRVSGRWRVRIPENVAIGCYQMNEASTNDYVSRFLLRFIPKNDSSEAEDFAYCFNGLWIITNEGKATLQVIDLTGRILSSERINGCCEKYIQAAAGVYMLRLINGDKVKVQKIVVK